MVKKQPLVKSNLPEGEWNTKNFNNTQYAQQDEKSFWSTRIRGHVLYLVFTYLSHSGNTELGQILNMRPKVVQLEISTGPWRISRQAHTGPYTISDGKFSGDTVTLTPVTSHFPVSYSHIWTRPLYNLHSHLPNKLGAGWVPNSRVGVWVGAGRLMDQVEKMCGMITSLIP